MDIYMLDEQDYDLLDLTNSPYKLKQIPDNSKGMYLMMYSLYMKFFTEYIIRNTQIKEIDESLQQNSNIINFVTDDEKDSYQLLSNNMLKYFYVRNNLYLHRLDKNELEVLSNKIQNNDFTYDDNIEKFITNTFKKVILEYADKNANELVRFGPLHRQYFAPNNSIVIGVRFKEASNFDEYYNQINILKQNLDTSQENLSSKLNYGVAVINYNGSSIKKKINEGGIKK